MDINEKRRRVADAYGSSSYTWKRRVASMSDNQILAIFQRFVKQGLIKH